MAVGRVSGAVDRTVVATALGTMTAALGRVDKRTEG